MLYSWTANHILLPKPLLNKLSKGSSLYPRSSKSHNINKSYLKNPVRRSVYFSTKIFRCFAQLWLTTNRPQFGHFSHLWPLFKVFGQLVQINYLVYSQIFLPTLVIFILLANFISILVTLMVTLSTLGEPNGCKFESAGSVCDSVVERSPPAPEIRGSNRVIGKR